MITIVLCGSYAEFHLWYRDHFPYLSSGRINKWFISVYDDERVLTTLSIERNSYYLILPGFHNLSRSTKTYILTEMARREHVKIELAQ